MTVRDGGLGQTVHHIAVVPQLEEGCAGREHGDFVMTIIITRSAKSHPCCRGVFSGRQYQGATRLTAQTNWLTTFCCLSRGYITFSTATSHVRREVGRACGQTRTSLSAKKLVSPRVDRHSSFSSERHWIVAGAKSRSRRCKQMQTVLEGIGASFLALFAW